MSYKVSITIEKDEQGYHAYSPALEVSQAQGDSLEEVMAKIKEPIELYLETWRHGDWQVSTFRYSRQGGKTSKTAGKGSAVFAWQSPSVR